jgi:hypothetical protein
MNKNNTAPPAARRGVAQYALGVLLLAYLAIAWRYLSSMMVLVDFGILSPVAALLMLSGSAFLVLGVVRHLLAPRLGKYCMLFAALELAIAAPQIGQWDYRLSQAMLAVLVFGIVIALFGAWRAHRRS